MFKELLKDALPLIEKSAPLVANALGGPMAGSIVSLLATVFQADVKNPAELASKIIDHPNALKMLTSCDQHMINCQDQPLGLYEKMHKPTKFNLNIEWDNCEDKEC